VRALDVLGLDVASERGSPLVLLREQEAPHRVLPIFVGGREAIAIALALGDQAPPRPLTHDLLAELIETLDARVDHVAVTGVSDGTFVAELALRGPHGGVSLDSRPSDAIALALRMDAPLFASDAVLDEAGRLVKIDIDGEAIDDDEIGDIDEWVVTDDREVDDEMIDDDLDRFRRFLDDVDASDFGKHDGPDGPGASGA
jgi:uncharacterized protein